MHWKAESLVRYGIEYDMAWLSPSHPNKAYPSLFLIDKHSGPQFYREFIGK